MHSRLVTSFISMTAVAQCSWAGTFVVTPVGAGLDAIATGIWGTNYDMDQPGTGTQLDAWITTDGTYTSISGAPFVWYSVVWQPSSPGDTPPANAYVTFNMDANLYGPNGSTASITNAQGTILDNSLGQQGTFTPLYSFTVTSPLVADFNDSNYSGWCYIPLDTLSSQGGSTVLERATFTSASGQLTMLRKKGRIIRKFKYRDEYVLVFESPRDRRRPPRS